MRKSIEEFHEGGDKLPKQNSESNLVFNLTLLITAFVITVICTLTGSYLQGGSKLKVGGVSDKRYKATKRIENTIATERNRQEAEKDALEMKPIRKKDLNINERVLKNVSDLFIKLDAIRSDYQKELIEQAEAQRNETTTTTAETTESDTSGYTTPNVIVSPIPANTSALLSPDGSRLGIRQNKGIITQLISLPNPDKPLSAMEQINKLHLTLSDDQSRILLSLDDENYDKLKDAIRQSLKNVLDQGVQEVDAISRLSIQDEMSKTDISSDMRNIGYQIASLFLESNYIIDESATEVARKDIASRYTTVYLQKGETIVDEGHIISEEKYALLVAMNLISDGLQGSLIQAVASIFLEAVLFSLCFIYFKTFCHKLLTHKKEAALLFTIYTVVVIAIRLLVNVPFQFLPILIFTMLVAMLIDLRLSIILNVFITIAAMLINQGGIEFLIFFTIAGLAISLLTKYTTERNHVFMIGIISCVLSFTLMFIILIFFQRSYSIEIVETAGYAAGNGIFTVIVCVGSLPFWEAFFGVTTNIKLLDLTNPNNALLRKLIIEAPGTYHHSLVVANLAETAAYEIGADANLARVGGYYHDIGKMKNPQFFVENQNHLNENPHNSLTPLESVNIIIEHVRYGLKLAGEFKLPQTVKDFILQHHGTSLIQYFYCNAKEACLKGEKVNENDYRYPFIIPQSKETAILMMADTLEAALRSMKKGFKDSDAIETDIKRLIRAKLDDGQLLDSGLSIKDLELITKAFLRVFNGMYHERIEYPKMEVTEISPAEGEVSTA